MLIPITRKKFEELIPLTATADQYKYYWGKFPDILQRVLISVAAVVAVLILRAITGGRFEIIIAFLGAAAGLYWLWQPVYRAHAVIGNAANTNTAASFGGKSWICL